MEPIKAGVHEVGDEKVYVTTVEIEVRLIDDDWLDPVYIACFRHRKDLVGRSFTSAAAAVGQLILECPNELPAEGPITVYGIGLDLRDLNDQITGRLKDLRITEEAR